MNFVPATITNEDEFGLPIVCHFAPETISVTKLNT